MSKQQRETIDQMLRQSRPEGPQTVAATQHIRADGTASSSGTRAGRQPHHRVSPAVSRL
jgi:hypothetical protein